MDDQVKRAMARWPAVPAVYGWLRLGRRGTWFLIDRNAPGFDPVRDSGGSPITSPPIIDFIHRNYEADAEGNWYFQNGPQRVFVTLDHAPLIFRVIGDDDDDGASLALAAQTGQPVTSIEEAHFDRQGNLFLRTDIGPGMLDDRDLVRLMALGDEPERADARDDLNDESRDKSRAGDGVGEGRSGGRSDETARLSLPRYGFQIDWHDEAEHAALPLESIASRYGFRRHPRAPEPAAGQAAEPAPDRAPD